MAKNEKSNRRKLFDSYDKKNFMNIQITLEIYVYR